MPELIGFFVCCILTARACVIGVPAVFRARRGFCIMMDIIVTECAYRFKCGICAVFTCVVSVPAVFRACRRFCVVVNKLMAVGCKYGFVKSYLLCARFVRKQLVACAACVILNVTGGRACGCNGVCLCHCMTGGGDLFNILMTAYRACVCSLAVRRAGGSKGYFTCIFTVFGYKVSVGCFCTHSTFLGMGAVVI